MFTVIHDYFSGIFAHLATFVYLKYLKELKEQTKNVSSSGNHWKKKMTLYVPLWIKSKKEDLLGGDISNEFLTASLLR